MKSSRAAAAFFGLALGVLAWLAWVAIPTSAGVSDRPLLLGFLTLVLAPGTSVLLLVAVISGKQLKPVSRYALMAGAYALGVITSLSALVTSGKLNP